MPDQLKGFATREPAKRAPPRSQFARSKLEAPTGGCVRAGGTAEEAPEPARLEPSGGGEPAATCSLERLSAFPPAARSLLTNGGGGPSRSDKAVKYSARRPRIPAGRSSLSRRSQSGPIRGGLWSLREGCAASNELAEVTRYRPGPEPAGAARGGGDIGGEPPHKGSILGLGGALIGRDEPQASGPPAGEAAAS